jgi:hypothetical protein
MSNKLSKELRKAVETELRKDCRKEALLILELGDDKDREDFLRYHEEDSGNICCLVLDYAKKKLIEADKWKYCSDDCFNPQPFDEDFNENEDDDTIRKK